MKRNLFVFGCLLFVLSCQVDKSINEAVKNISNETYSVFKFSQDDNAKSVKRDFSLVTTLPNGAKLEWSLPSDTQSVLNIQGNNVAVSRPRGVNKDFTFSYVIVGRNGKLSNEFSVSITVLGIDVLVTDIQVVPSICLVVGEERALPSVVVEPPNASVLDLSYTLEGNSLLHFYITSKNQLKATGVSGSVGELKISATDGSGVFKMVSLKIVDKQIAAQRIRVLPEVDHVEVNDEKQIYGKVYPTDYTNAVASYSIIAGQDLATIDSKTGKMSVGSKTGTVTVQYAIEGEGVEIAPVLSTIHIVNKITDVSTANYDTAKDITLLDLDRAFTHQKIIDKAPGVYRGHPSATMTHEGNLVLLYPDSHGIGKINMLTSSNNGNTWKKATNIPSQWDYSAETPTIYRLDLTNGQYRYIQVSGHPDRTGGVGAECQETTGFDWSFSKNAIEWDGFYHKDTYFDGQKYGNTVAFADVIQLKDQTTGEFIDKWMCVAHESNSSKWKNLLITLSFDGGGYERENLVWSEPRRFLDKNKNPLPDNTNLLCEVGLIRSPDHTTIAALFRNQAHNNSGSYIAFSNDEGQTWSDLKQMPSVLDGERHQGAYFKDGRLIILFREMILRGVNNSQWYCGELGAWVGTFLDLQKGGIGQYLICLKRDYTPNAKSGDCGYSTLDLLPDGSMFMSSYGVFDTDGTLEWSKNAFGSLSALGNNIDWSRSAASGGPNSTYYWSPYIMSFCYQSSDFDNYAKVTHSYKNGVVTPGRVPFNASWRKFPKGPNHESALPEEHCSGDNSCKFHLKGSQQNVHSTIVN